MLGGERERGGGERERERERKSEREHHSWNLITCTCTCVLCMHLYPKGIIYLHTYKDPNLAVGSKTTFTKYWQIYWW
jgi:hypothetical protein